MAVALFGAVVTTILSAQASLVAGDRTALNMSQAIELGRCKMSELEEKQLKLGFPEIEEKDTSPYCCDDKEVTGFNCAWTVERVLLPQPQQLGGEGGLNSVLGGGLGLDAGAIGAGLTSTVGSPLGNMAINPLGGATLDLDAGLKNIGTSLQSSFGGAGVSGLLTLVFSLVYPSLKPLLETAIRKVTVTVNWKEGVNKRDFVLTQYITNPSQVSLLASLMEAGAMGDSGLTGGSSVGAPNVGGAARSPVAAPVGMH